jgi:hypothetical protein
MVPKPGFHSALFLNAAIGVLFIWFHSSTHSSFSFFSGPPAELTAHIEG